MNKMNDLNQEYLGLENVSFWVSQPLSFPGHSSILQRNLPQFDNSDSRSLFYNIYLQLSYFNCTGWLDKSLSYTELLIVSWANFLTNRRKDGRVKNNHLLIPHHSRSRSSMCCLILCEVLFVLSSFDELMVWYCLCCLLKGIRSIENKIYIHISVCGAMYSTMNPSWTLHMQSEGRQFWRDNWHSLTALIYCDTQYWKNLVKITCIHW